MSTVTISQVLVPIRSVPFCKINMRGAEQDTRCENREDLFAQRHSMHQPVHSLHTQRLQIKSPQRDPSADVPDDHCAVVAAAAEARAGAGERLKCDTR